MEDLLICFNRLFQYGPFSSWKLTELTLLTLVILGAVLIVNYNRWTREEKLFRTAAWFYLYLIIVYTLISRTGQKDLRYHLTLFWSYQSILTTHNLRLALQVIFNCMMFVPFGVLLPLAYENVLHQDDIKKRNTVIFAGLAVSISVECLQLFTRTGWFEWDDMLHNTIGMIVGYGIYLFIRGRQYHEVHWYFLPFNMVLLALLLTIV